MDWLVVWRADGGVGRRAAEWTGKCVGERVWTNEMPGSRIGGCNGRQAGGLANGCMDGCMG